jgi:hypothetical protein
MSNKQEHHKMNKKLSSILCKIQLIASLFLANIILGVLYLRISPVCYQYLKGSFSSIKNLLDLIANMPSFWSWGFTVMLYLIIPIFSYYFFGNIKNIFETPLPLCVVCAFLLAFLLTFFWKNLSFTNRNILLSLITIFLNFASLESFFASMSV